MADSVAVMQESFGQAWGKSSLDGAQVEDTLSEDGASLYLEI